LPLEAGIVEQGSSSWLEQSRLIQAEGFEYRGDAGLALADNIKKGWIKQKIHESFYWELIMKVEIE